MLFKFYNNAIQNSFRFLLMLLVLPALVFAQNAGGDFTLTGNIKGLPDSTMVFLSKAAQPTSVLATAYSQSGKFILFGKVADPDIYQLSFIGRPEQADIFLTPANLAVSGEAKALKNLVVTGSVAQNDYKLYTARFNILKEKLTKLAGVINNTPQGDRRDSLINVFEKQKKQVLTQVDLFVKSKPASPVSAFVIYMTSPVSNDIPALEARYAVLKPAVKETMYGREILRYIASTKVGTEGSQAVDFTQADTANHPVSLSSFRGKYVLVDFWASWCGPCRHENPAVVNAFNTYKDKNFTILGVSLDQNRDKWLQAIHVDNLTWTHVSDLKYWQNEVAQIYHISSIPANMLLDPDGKIIARNLRGAELYETLRKLLK